MPDTTTRPWLCPRDETCPAGSHDTYSAYRNGCRSGAAGEDKYLYAKRHKVGTAQPRLVSPVGIARRIQACHYTGYTGVEIGAELGVSRRRVNELQRMNRGHVRASTIPRMAPVLEALAMRPAPDGTRNKYMRTWARGQGFQPLLAWDNIDDPDEVPPPPASDADQVGELVARGYSTAYIAEKLDLPFKRVRYLRDRESAREAPPIDEHLFDAVAGLRRPLVDCTDAEQDYIVARLWRRYTGEGYANVNSEIARHLELDGEFIHRVHNRISRRRLRQESP